MNKEVSAGMTTDRTVTGVMLSHGTASGPVKLLRAPLSFWGGYDSANGVIVEKTHPCFGQSLAGSVMVMPRAKGSSSSSSVLAEAIRNGTGPVGIILRERDLIIAIGAIVASDLYAIHVPVVALSEVDFDAVCTADGIVRIHACADHGTASVTWSVPAAV